MVEPGPQIRHELWFPIYGHRIFMWIMPDQIMSRIPMWFKFHIRNHMKWSWAHVYHDLIQSFLCLIVNLMPQIRQELWLFNLWSQDYDVIYVWQKTLHLYLCDLGFKRNHMKWNWAHFYQVMLQCSLCLVVNLMPQIRQEPWFFNLWSQDCHVNYAARPKSCHLFPYDIGFKSNWMKWSWSHV